MSDMPAWLESLLQTVADAMTCDAVPGPLGVRRGEEDRQRLVIVYPMPVEWVEGVDGKVGSPGFSLDLERLRSAFSRVDALDWDAHGLGLDGIPSISIEGMCHEQEVWLQVLAFAPEGEEPGMKLYNPRR